MGHIVKFFRFFGDPAVFFLKILLWTVVWSGKQLWEILQKIKNLLIGLLTTIFWFLQLIKKPKFLKKPRLRIRPTIKFSRPTIKIPSFFWGFVACFFLLFIPYNITVFLQQLPHPQLLANGNLDVTTKIFDRNRNLLYEIYADQNRTPVKLTELPKYVPQAHIAIEDKNFYHHLGIDPLGIFRALVANLKNLPVQGGSTITQQLIKSALLTPQRTIERKIREIILSFWAERIYSKDKILEMYLNQISYGGSAYGIETASQTYFGKTAKELTLAESAFLAGLPAAPSVYSPYGTHPEEGKSRQLSVLKAMHDQGYIDLSQMEKAREEKLNFYLQDTTIKAPHFVMYVKDLLIRNYGAKRVERGGLEVVTSLDLPTYEMAVKEIKDGVAAQKGLNVGNGAAIITYPKTGEILAMVGSTDYFNKDNDGNVNVVLAQRSPGSSIKVVNYAAALDKKIITPATVFDDNPVNFNIPGQPVYRPQNYDNKWHGNVTVRTALASSFNIPAVKILAKLGVTEMIGKGREMGITSWVDQSRYGLSLTLGGGEVTMLDLAEVYGSLANNGIKVNLNPILSVKDYKGQILEQKNIKEKQVLSPQTAFMMSDILSDNGARTPAFGPSSSLVIPGRTVAVKTGTAETKRDNWTAGYTPDLLTIVWVGNNDNSPMSPYLESGNTGAAAIWHQIMVNLLQDKPNQSFARPQNLNAVTVCAINGLLPCENCPHVKTEYFVPGTEPKTACKIEKKEEKKD